jgi:CO dehydrogenase maturation factor
MKRPRIIAVCGKGGVGKTSISAVLVRCLSTSRRNRVLAIDADPAVGLATALGFGADRSVDRIRNDLIAELEAKTAGSPDQIAERLDYELLQALEERDNLAFLAVGRPEKAGCYCQVNAVLRDLIASLAGSFDHVIIDGEAGIEQVNRRVMASVTHLLLVSDFSQKGLTVAATIAEVAKTAMHCEQVGLVVNRSRGDEASFTGPPAGLPLLAVMPEDDRIRQADMKGLSVWSIPEDNRLLQAVRDLLEKIR